jgi:cell division protein ZapA
LYKYLKIGGNMAIVAINVGGREYNLACDDGQEEHLCRLADEVDGRMRSLSERMGGRLSENMGLLLTAITMADELIENKRQITNYGNYDEASVVSALGEIAERMENMATHYK